MKDRKLLVEISCTDWGLVAPCWRFSRDAGVFRPVAVSRWPHGYAYEYRDLYDPSFPRGKAPHRITRLPWGNVAIANADAGASA